MGDLSGSRECHVIKKPTEEFEFFLKDDPSAGQVITSVTKDGPAYRAGLKDGDKVISINGEKVGDKDHNSVVAIIRDCIPKNEVKFVVITKSNDTAYKKNPSQAKQSTKSSSSQKKTSTSIDAKPRVCKIKKKNDSFGFYMAAQESNKGHFIKSVTKGGPADGTGLRDRDRIIAVGKTNVEKLSHAQVVATIKKSGNKCSLLVIDEEGYQEYQKRGTPITEKMAKSGGSTSSRKSTSSEKSKSSTKTKKSTSSVIEFGHNEHEGKVRVVHVVKPASKGYGFFLKSRKSTGEEYIDSIDKDGAADICGLINNDRVVAVNGKSTIGMNHDEVIGLIKEKQCQVVFVVFDGTAAKLFKEKDDYPSKDDIVYTHKHKIRSAKLAKEDGGYGMYLKMEKGCPFHIFCDIEKGKPAHEAGLKDGDILIAVEGEGVLTATHEDCVKKIKDAGNSCEMIVGGRKTAEFLHKLGVAIVRELVEQWPTEKELQVPSLGKIIKDILEESKAPLATVVVAKQVYDNLKYKPRLCRIKRRDGGFGFFLKDDNGHYLTNVEKGGPSSDAGVLELDRIVEVNGKNVEERTHNELVQIIRESEDEVTFLLVSKEEDAYFKENNILITAALLDAVINDELDDDHRPRLCILVRTETGLGFHLTGEGDRDGQFIKDILPRGAADNAGLKEGDRIIEVNGVNVIGESHDAVVKRIKEREHEVTFLVADKECDEYYKRKKMVIVASMIAARAISETEERNQEECESLHSTSATSSIIETEATVHKEDDKEIEVEDEGHAAAAVVAAVVVANEIKEENEEREETIEAVEDAVEEILEERQEEREEEIREQREEILEDLAKNVFVAEVIEEVIEQKEEERKEEVIEAVQDSIEDAVEDVVEERQEEERLEKVENVIKVAAAAEIIEEIREEREENREEIEEFREEIEEFREDKVELQEEREEIREEIEEVLEEQEDRRAAAAAAEKLEDKISEEERREEEIRQRVEEALKQYKREEEAQKKIEETVEDYLEKKEDEAKPPAMKVAQAMVMNEMMNKVENSSKSGYSSDYESDEAKEAAKAVVNAVKEERTPEPAAPVIPLAEILKRNSTSDREIVKGQITEPKKTTPLWSRQALKPVNKQPPIIEAAPTPPSTPNDDKKEVTSPTTKSSVALMREAIERRNREMEKARGSSIGDDLADLRKRSGVAAKRMEMFGGSSKKPSTNGYGPPKPQKQSSWSGEGMTIKIVET